MFKHVLDKAKTLAASLAHGRPPDGAPVAAMADLTLTRLDGTPLAGESIAGKVVLFVNVASRCGLTPQYAGLVALHERYHARGLVVIGVPCNQFFGQEPGSGQAIAEFCSTTYGVDFPLLEKQAVNGRDRSPLYQWLIASPAGGGQDIAWNFEKFVVGRDGAVVARFAPKVEPQSPEVFGAIEGALGPRNQADRLA